MEEIPIKYQLGAEPKNFLELWKWFTDDAAKIKDRMWTMATFFYTVLGALLGFLGKQLESGDGLFLHYVCRNIPAGSNSF